MAEAFLALNIFLVIIMFGPECRSAVLEFEGTFDYTFHLKAGEGFKGSFISTIIINFQHFNKKRAKKEILTELTLTPMFERKAVIDYIPD